jgi:hypothetical protein
VFWEDVQKYKQAQDEEQRIAIGQHLRGKYLSAGAPFELNIQKEMADSVFSTMDKMGDNLPYYLFDRLEDHCLSDMRDVFSRFKDTAEGVDILKEMGRENRVMEIMEISGMIEHTKSKYEKEDISEEIKQPLLYSKINI